MIIKCTREEQILIKRSIKANECTTLCSHKPECTKSKDMTCGEYVISKIKWEVIS
jgi:hypothetical protein